MPKYKAIISYDGTDYHGFQVQLNALTIQEVIEKSLTKLYGRKTRVEPAGRTDAGVHARGQVIGFFAPPVIPEKKIPLALNGVLPGDIVTLDAARVGEHFSPRREAEKKFYSYSIDNSFFPDVFWRRYSWHIPQSLDLQRMKEGAGHLLGKHDFKAFQSTGTFLKSTVRTLFSLEIEQHGSLVRLNYEGSGFLYKMVRNITGTLVEVGLGKREPQELQKILQSKDRQQAGEAAPAAGLCLEKVVYPAEREELKLDWWELMY